MRRTIAALIAGLVLGSAGAGLAAPTFWRYITIPNNGNTSIKFNSNTKYTCAYHPSNRGLFCATKGPFSVTSPDMTALQVTPSGASIYTADGQVGVPTDYYRWAH